MRNWRNSFFGSWSKERRTEVAGEKMDKVIDHLDYLLKIQANNDHIPALSQQIPTSYARHAFNAFAISAHQIELARFCALWDAVSVDRENIPTVAAMVDDDEIIEKLAEIARAQNDNRGFTTDPITQNEREIFIAQDRQRGIDEGNRVRRDLSNAIADAYAIWQSDNLQPLMDVRHTYVAHNLSRNDRDKGKAVIPVDDDDLPNLIEQTIPIVLDLHRCVNGKGYALESAREFHRKNAARLWTHCKFTELE